MKKALITGPTGFVGQRLIATAPDDVKIISPNDWEKFDEADYIIHAAGYAAPVKFLQDPLRTIQINSRCVTDLFWSLSDKGSRFVYCSTCEVYRGLVHAAIEDEIGTTTPYHKHACYIESKKCGETIVNEFRKSGENACSVRMGLTYGPGTKKHDTRIINKFIEQALTTGKIELQDAGNAAVTYCYINDMCRMIWKVLENGTQSVYNIGGKHTVTIKELAYNIASIIGADVIEKNEPVMTQFQPIMNTNRFYNEFGPFPLTGWIEGLKKTIDYQRELYAV